MGIYRVFLAVAVIGFHVGLPFMGPLAIYMFYIFSGYLIHYLLEKYSSETKRFVKKFISSRVIKLFPSYFFVIIFLYLNNFLLKKLFNEVLYLNLDFSISDFSQIIQSFFPIISINLYEPYLILDSKSVPVFWTVFNEIIFYTIFILVFLISKKTKINFIKLFYVISLSLHVYLASKCLADLSMYNLLVYRNVFGSLIFFALGSFIYYNSRMTLKNYKIFNLNMIIVIFFIFLMPQIKIPDALIAGYSSLGILITSYILAFITSFALMNFKVGIQTRRDKYLSTLSYYIYVHQTIGFAILGALISNFNIPESKNILFIIVLGMTFLSLLIQNIIFKFLKKFKRFYGKT